HRTAVDLGGGGGDDDREAEDLGRAGERNQVIAQRLAILRPDAEGEACLRIDEDEGAARGIEKGEAHWDNPSVDRANLSSTPKAWPPGPPPRRWRRRHRDGRPRPPLKVWRQMSRRSESISINASDLRTGSPKTSIS